MKKIQAIFIWNFIKNHSKMGKKKLSGAGFPTALMHISSEPEPVLSSSDLALVWSGPRENQTPPQFCLRVFVPPPPQRRL